MSRATENQYIPDYVSHPGETLGETLEAMGMSQAELAERTGRARKTINEIVKGKAPITAKIALELENVLGVPAGFWNNRESQYREYLARKDELERFEKQLQWLDSIPVHTMTKYGWIKGFNDKFQQLREVLRFFQIGSPAQWERHVGTYLDHVAFRKSEAFESNRGAVIAWLRKGEIEAWNVECAPFDQGGFRHALDLIRGLTAEPPKVFQPKMVELASAAGVAVVFVRELPKTRVSGAARWLSPTKALIQLSLLYKRNDHFWFSFFHEAGHILMHGRRDIFIDHEEKCRVGHSAQEEKEREANSFAADFLIPQSKYRTLTNAERPSKRTILSFASELGIAPGIIVGRLQREGIIPWNFYNDLKVAFRWHE